MHRHPGSPKLFDFNFSQHSNSHFTQTTGFISWIRVGIENILLVKKFFDARVVDLFYLLQCLGSPKIPRSATLFFTSLKFQTCICQLLHSLLHRELSLKHNTRRVVLRCRTVHYVRCIRVWLVQILQKKTFINNFSRHSNASSFFTHKYRLHFFYLGLNEKLFSWKTISMVILCFCSLQWIADLPIPEYCYL